MRNMVKTKKYWDINNVKMENNEFWKIGVKNRRCYYFDDISINFNILLDEKSYDIFLFCDIQYKTLIDDDDDELFLWYG